MRVAINIPRMLPDNDFHFRLGHAAPARLCYPPTVTRYAPSSLQ
jgi:hypothetical protein